jgi:hypothetical protein
MRIRNGRVRDPGKVVINVERRRNELAEFVPKERQREIGPVSEKNDDGEAEQDGQLRALFHWRGFTELR